MDQHRTCTRCVMTNKGDPTITFDAQGHCNYCTQALRDILTSYFPHTEGEAKLSKMVTHLKEKNTGKRYDCMMGISGGLDSAYLAYLGAHKWGLRIAAVHLDDGYDTEVSKQNIARLCEACGIELKVVAPEPLQFNALCRAFMLAGVPNLAIPQDNILLAALYHYAQQTNISDFLSGANFALESILQGGNTHTPGDVVHIRDIFRRFGQGSIDTLPLMSNRERQSLRSTLAVAEYHPLNFVDYNRERAFQELKNFCGFEYYGSKHLENYFTAFLQLYWLPQKFGVDKRTSHLSSMIVSGQMTRDEALAELAQPPVSTEWLENTVAVVKKQMGFSDEEFELLMAQPAHRHKDYRWERAPITFKMLLHRCYVLNDKLQRKIGLRKG